MSEAIPFINSIVGFIKSIKSYSNEKKKLLLDATFAIQAAINQTQNYISKNEGEQKESMELSNIWVAAARAIHPFDSHLSQMLVHKSDFWAYPDRWINEGIGDTIISLRDLREVTEMLRVRLS